MRFRIIMTARELYDVEAETETEAYELIETGQTDPIYKKHFGENIVIEGEDEDISIKGEKIA
jgi:hypothetical protein